MKLIIAGTGPGDNELITIEAINFAAKSDIVIAPRSRENMQGNAERIISHHLPQKKLTPIFFPMVYDSGKRDGIIFTQLQNIKPELENAKLIFFPVIGDSVLYSTGAYLLEAWQKIFPESEISFIPGISAHSLASSCAKRFMAMSDEIFSIIPGTAEREKIIEVLKNSDSAAIYKPIALKNIRDVIEQSGGCKKILRVDFAGIPDREKIFEGEDALNNIEEYLSIILIWK